MRRTLEWSTHAEYDRDRDEVIDSRQRMLWAARVLSAVTPPQHRTRLCELAEARSAHDHAYVQGLEALAACGSYHLDPELRFDATLWRAARAACAATSDAVLAAQGNTRALHLCVSRPGSHHASRGFALGCCVLNNLAVGAHAALASTTQRVAIIDFDAHHGNGTQDIFWDDPRVLCVSLHQYPFFPGSGAAGERGPHDTIANYALPAGTDHGPAVRAYAQALERVHRFQPSLILAEAGLDAHAADHTSDLLYTDETFYSFGCLTAKLLDDLRCPLVAELGGGYTESALVGGLTALLDGFGVRS